MTQWNWNCYYVIDTGDGMRHYGYVNMYAGPAFLALCGLFTSVEPRMGAWGPTQGAASCLVCIDAKHPRWPVAEVS